MQQIYPDLWQSAPQQPYESVPDLITRAYLLATEIGNVLIYNTGLEDELRDMGEIGGVARQYLSHIDEAGPSIARIRELYGAELWCHAAEAEAVKQQAGVAPSGTFDSAEMHPGDLEILPLPGHTIGSTCFFYRSRTGKNYLFTGDTLGLDRSGQWLAGYIPSMSDKAALLATLDQLEQLHPDVVFSSAFGDPHPYREVTASEWRKAVHTARDRLRSQETTG